MVINKTEFINNKARINNLLEQLRKKVRGFEVINLKGQSIGTIRDFILDKYRRLYLIIPQSDAQSNSAVYLLSSKYIQKVDTLNQAIFVDISLAKFHKLPLYYPSNQKGEEITEASPRLPVNPASFTGSSEMRDRDKTQPLEVHSLATEELEPGSNQSVNGSDDTPEVLEEQTVPLLEERVIVNRSKRKIGEIVVRKQIETRFVEVPIQREQLIIEKVGSASQQPVEVEHVPVDQVSNERGIDRSRHFPTPLATGASVTNPGETQPSISQSSLTPQPEEVDHPNFHESDDAIEVVEEEIVRLLEERLVVNRSKWKVGEVIVRKEIENQIVQVPIRREKLIIEQVSPTTKQIAEIDLGEGEITGIALKKAQSSDPLYQEGLSSDSPYTVTGEFLSPKAASHLLEAIALQGRHGCAKVRVELVLDNPELQQTYQNMFDRCSC